MPSPRRPARPYLTGPCAARTRRWCPPRTSPELSRTRQIVGGGWQDQLDVLHPRRLREPVQDVVGSPQLLVVLVSQKHVGRPATVGDVDRTAGRGPLRAACVLIEVSTTDP